MSAYRLVERVPSGGEYDRFGRSGSEGGLSLARAAKGPALSDRILAACRKLAVLEGATPRAGGGTREGDQG